MPIQRNRIVIGGLVGLALTAALTAIMYMGQQFADLAYVPFDLFDGLARIPQLGGIITKFIDFSVSIFSGPGVRTDAASKTLEHGIAVVQFLVIGAIVGAVYAALTARADERAGRILPLFTALVLWGITGIIEVLMPSLQSKGLLIELVWIGALYILWAYALAWALRGILVITGPRGEISPTLAASRRKFIIQLSGSIAAVTLGGWGIGTLSPKRSSSAVAGQALPTPTAGPTPIPSQEAAVSSSSNSAFIPAPGMRPEITANDQFYQVDINTLPPDVNEKQWTLTVEGLVDQPLKISYDQLLKLPSIEQDATLECISNEVGGSLISSVRWRGVRLADVLKQAGLKSGVVEIRFVCVDGYTESLPLDSAMDERTILAYAMNGIALNRQHGFPLRLYTPNRYGMKNPKWITTIEAVNQPYSGYWEDRGWDKEAIVKTTSVIDVVATDKPENGLVPIGGIAFSGARQISKVEISVDGGDWQPAQLKDAISPLTWRFWRYDWKGTPGQHQFKVRAVDGEGKLQTDKIAPLHPDGASGYDSTTASL